MKVKFTLICFVLISFVMFGQSDSLLIRIEIPTYSYHNLRLYGQDFFNYLRTNYLEQGSKTENINVNMGRRKYVFTKSYNNQ